MLIEIRNPKISKSRKSINFQFEGRWHSFKVNILHSFGYSINNIEGKVISVQKADIDFSKGWVMIHDFKIASQLKQEFEPEHIKVPSKDNLYQERLSLTRSFSDTKEFKVRELQNFPSIDPLCVKNNIYSDSYSHVSWRIEFSCLTPTEESQQNSIISAIQNFVSRSYNSKSPNSARFSFISVLILETMKYNKEKYKIVLPKSMLEDGCDSLKDVEFYINIFSKITGGTLPLISSDVFEVYDGEEIRIINEQRKIFFKMRDVSNSGEEMISFIRKTTILYKDILKNKNEINKLLKLSFGSFNSDIKKFKDEQIEALNILMHNGGNMLAILRTGFGKSLIYQFSVLLQPRVFINVFPIVALISDQSKSLTEEFKFGFSINNENLKKVSQAKLNSGVLYSKRLFLVTPERIENQKMQEYFASLGEYIGFMVFDEAHCISEWGHDFRPSYLMSKRLLENLTLAHDIKVIALTATAAPHIQKDISNLLNIPRKNIVNIADSSGLERKEITYNIKHIKAYDFDIWNRSKTYSKIIDEHVKSASKIHKQLIIFHMKAGSKKDIIKDKYKKKISAWSTHKRLTNDGLRDVTLFTGKVKMLNGVLETDFKKLSSSKHVIATKSFGMGINLINCDYVLLTEPPYSLEDLYQQSGRVGRAGQKSSVEILYHNNVLLDPFLKKSPYNFFLLIKEERIKIQPIVLKKLIEEIKKYGSPFTIDVKMFLKKIDIKARAEHLMWAIAHLITNFKIIDKYSVVYQGFSKKSINIVPANGLEDAKKNIKDSLDKMRIISKNNTLDSLIDSFYDNYFRRLQTDKITGINIFISKLLESDNSISNDSKLITNVLTEYYKTRVDDVDKYVISLMGMLDQNKSFENIIAFIKEVENGIPIFEIMESISRYEIDFEYIITASALVNIIHKEKMLATSWNEILSHEFKNEKLQELILASTDLGMEHIKTEEIENEKIRELLEMSTILKGLKNGE